MRDGDCQFLSGKALSREIKAVLSEDNVRVAVAFWGRGSDNHMTGAGARIICNLSMGGTNPHAIRSLTGAVRHLADLHAKVYLTRDRAVVASANVSANGLGHEGTEQAFWREAGVLTRDIVEIERWFETLWSEAAAVTDADLNAAEIAWTGRQSVRPALYSFAHIDPDAEDFPLVAWLNRTQGWQLIDEAFADVEPSLLQSTRDRADRGIEVGGDADVRVLRDRWVLFFPRTGAGKADQRTRPWLQKAGKVILQKSFRYDDDDAPRDVYLAPEEEQTPPFDPADDRFVQAFRTVIDDPRIAALLEDDDGAGDWYAQRLDEMRLFWHLMKQSYGPE